MSKIWEKPWNLADFIENSDKWTLAGDVALLNTLQSFADNLFKKGGEINDNINNLTENLNKQWLKLNLVQNQFQRLRNSQFIESRVYEDDEESLVDEKKVEEEVKEENDDQLKLAIEKGLIVIDKYFDKVQVDISDTEDEGELPNYILKLKDPYLHRPLPYVIGSDEWKKDSHVGLDTSSESENEEEENYSSGSDELALSITNPILDNESSDFNPYNNNNNIKEEITPQITPVNQINFAQQLAAKLDEITNEEINRRPIQKQPQIYNNLLNDEPPPFEENKGLFSSSGGLFDDDDDDDDEDINDNNNGNENFDNESENASKDIFNDYKFKNSYLPTTNNKTLPLFDNEPPSLEDEIKKKPIGGVKVLGDNLLKQVQRVSSSSSDDENDEKDNKIKDIKPKLSLFDDNDNDDDDLFSNTAPVQKKSLLFDDDDNLFEEVPSIKSVNSVNLLFNDEPPPIKNDDKKIEVKNKPKTKISLFDDDSPDDNFFNTITKNTLKEPGPFQGEPKRELFDSKTKSLFDDNLPDDDLFDEVDKRDTPVQPLHQPEPINKTSLFNDVPPVDDLFDKKENTIKSGIEDSVPTDKTIEEKGNPSKKISLFDDKPPEDAFINIKQPQISIFDDDFKDNYLESSNNPPSIRKVSLFDDEPLEDLFDNEVKQKDSPYKVEVENKPKEPTKSSGPSLFDNESPENLFETHKIIKEDKQKSIVAQLTEKLSESPETSQKINSSSPGKLKLSLNINVGALMPCAMPPKIKSPPPTEETDNIKEGSASDRIKEITEDDKSESPVENESKGLHHINKDRARAPVNRRPSTRRARQTALRALKSEFSLSFDEQINNLVDNKEIEEKPHENKDNLDDETTPIPTPTLFDTELVKSESFKDEKGGNNAKQLFDDIPSLEPPSASKHSLFDDFSDDEDNFTPLGTTIQPSVIEEKLENIFNKTKEQNVPSTISTPQTESLLKNENKKGEIIKKSIFDEDDNDDDLFFTKKPLRKPNKKSLFDDDDDDDDDDDIFGPSASTTTTTTKQKPQRPPIKTSTIKKLENTKPAKDDPLSDLFD